MNKTIVNEMFLLRFVACLAVVLVHSIEEAILRFELSVNEDFFFTSLRMIFLFGTPTFIFISEFLLAKSYPNELPKGFFRKRAKFLLIPYIAMGWLYALNDVGFSKPLLIEVFKNIFFANFTAYFIIIIFQFYILHYLLHKYLDKWNPKKVLVTSLLINVIYLGFFNFTEPVSFIPGANYIWGKFSWLPFLGWIFYFSVGYYCGKYYNEFKTLLEKYKYLLFVFPIITLSVILYFKTTGFIPTNSSKRIDIIFYTISLIFLVFYLSSKVKVLPSIVYIISNYSFSIYLLHKLIIDFLPAPKLFNVYFSIPYFLILSLLCSLIVSKIISKVPFGKFIVGNVQNYSNRLSSSSHEKKTDKMILKN